MLAVPAMQRTALDLEAVGLDQVAVATAAAAGSGVVN